MSNKVIVNGIGMTELIERDTPANPIMGTDQKGKIVLVCPSCDLDVVLEENFCSHCGQRLDWGK